MINRDAIHGVTRAVAVVAALAASVAGCGSDGERAARARYNEALAAIAEQRWDEAEAALLDARNGAGQDPELRFRAAFNLGVVYAGRADAPADAGDEAGHPGGDDPQHALDSLRSSAAWFRDAVRLRPDDDDARVNLELVLRRIQLLVDQLNKGQNSLLARLDRAIEDQRELLGRIRALLAAVEASGSAADPVEFQREFEALAAFERSLSADVGTVVDLAGDERALIENKPEEERTDEERGRLHQLGALDEHLHAARADLADARRLLRRLQGDAAHRRADAGLARLKRAREQLADPVAVLRSVAMDQEITRAQANALAALTAGTVTLAGPDRPNDGDDGDDGDDRGDGDDGDGAGEAPAPAPPAWLTGEYLGVRQADIRDRTDDVRARLAAGAAAVHAQAAGGHDAGVAQAGAAGAPGAIDPRQKRLAEAASEAVVHLDEATAAMQAAESALGREQPATAVPEQARAMAALLAAIERFADIRGLIELSYRDQAKAVALLTPPEQIAEKTGGNGGEAATLSRLTAAQRAELVEASVAANLDRMARLGGLFEDELARLAAQAQQAQAQAQAQAQQGQPGAPGAPGGGEPVIPPEIQAELQRYQAAEGIRGRVVDALERLRAATAAVASGRAVKPSGPGASGQAGAPVTIANEGLENIEELRRLFFSVVEHLEQLLADQTQTHDRTASASAAPDEEVPAQLGPLHDYQREHLQTAGAIAEALAQQADAAAAQGGQPGAAPGGDPAEMAQRLADAANEVRDAAGQMDAAVGLLGEDVDTAGTISHDLSPILEAQMQAIAHLEEALAKLKPPKQQDQQDQQQQDQQQQQEQQQEQQQQQGQQQQQQGQQPHEQQDMSQQQANRKLQEIRDREAERQRSRREQTRREPVEKDW